MKGDFNVLEETRKCGKATRVSSQTCSEDGNTVKVINRNTNSEN